MKKVHNLVVEALCHNIKANQTEASILGSKDFESAKENVKDLFAMSLILDSCDLFDIQLHYAGPVNVDEFIMAFIRENLDWDQVTKDILNRLCKFYKAPTYYETMMDTESPYGAARQRPIMDN